MSDVASAPSSPVGTTGLQRRLIAGGRFWANWRSRLAIWLRSHLADLAELAAISLLALWMGRAFLNLDPSQWAFGEDFPRHLPPFFQWPLLLKCGACVFWSGAINGGAPAFGDLFSPLWYPPVILTTIGWGAVNGAKLTVVISLIVAGFAQWWLARVLGLGRVARLWVAAMAIIGGHIAGRMQMGHVVMVTSVTASSLVLAPALQVGLTGQRRSVVALAITMALALVSGHGYIQLALLFGVVPALLIFLVDDQMRLRQVWRSYLLAAGLTVLLTGAFWLPLLNFWPNIVKEGDPYFGGAQPVVYTLLNMVIRERAFYDSVVLLQKPFPAMHMNYIGWIPLALAVVAVRLVPRRAWRTVAFLLLASYLVLLASSAFWFKLLNSLSGGFLSLGRHVSLLAPLAVPLVLAAAAWGLDELLKRNWPRLSLAFPAGRSLSLSAAWLLAIPLLWGLRDVYQFSHDNLFTYDVADADYPMEAFQPATMQWTAIPFGDLRYIAEGLEAGQKIVVDQAFALFNWRDRAFPPAYIELSRDPATVSNPGYDKVINGVYAVKHPDNQYAFVDTGRALVPCAAIAQGGNVDVTCRTDEPGTLIVRENTWSGWSARLDGRGRLPLRGGQWLSVLLPAGEHQIAFRYRPVDAMLGLLLTAIGLAVSVRLWLRPARYWPDEVPWT